VRGEQFPWHWQLTRGTTLHNPPFVFFHLPVQPADLCVVEPVKFLRQGRRGRLELVNQEVLEQSQRAVVEHENVGRLSHRLDFLERKGVWQVSLPPRNWPFLRRSFSFFKVVEEEAFLVSAEFAYPGRQVGVCLGQGVHEVVLEMREKSVKEVQVAADVYNRPVLVRSKAEIAQGRPSWYEPLVVDRAPGHPIGPLQLPLGMR
jgi:hypothetical protein